MENDRWAWDRYWQYDRVASCFDRFGRANYDTHIADGWRAFFESLPAEAAILDLCTGNGAIALLAIESSDAASKKFAVSGVDRAEIDPARFATSHRSQLERIHFRGGVSAENLPFADAAFDAVTSQYGIEYSDLDRSLAEAVRVLRPRGRLRFGMHALEGSVVAETAAGIADAEFMLCDVEFPRRAADCLRAVTAVERSGEAGADAKADADRAFAAFNQALAAISGRIAGAADRKMMENAASVILHAYRHRAHFPLEVLLEKVEEIAAEIDAHRLRQQALLDAAIGRERLDEIAGRLEQLGLAVRTSEQRSADGLVGYVVEGQVHR